VNQLAASLSPLQKTESKYKAADYSFELAELVGTYVGAQHHTMICTHEEGVLKVRRGHNPAISYKGEAKEIVLQRNTQGIVVPKPPQLPVSVCFFRASARRASRLEPVLMIGASAFRRLDVNPE
jgi:hypothetical protein